MFSKYILIKKMHPGYLVLIKKKDKFYTFKEDKVIYKYNKELKIDHIVLDGDDVVFVNDFNTNYELVAARSLMLEFFDNYRKDLCLWKRGLKF